MAKINNHRPNNPSAYQGRDRRNGPDIESEPGVFTLLTYNVKNMFDSQDAVKEKGSGEKPVWEVNAISKVVARSGADIMTNQEVENLGVYDQWARQNLQGAFPHTALIEGNDKRGIDVAAMSRYPIVKVVSHKENQFPLADQSGLTRFSRDLLRVDVDVQGEIVSLYTTHSYSRRRGKAEEVHMADNQRIAEAQAIKAIVSQEMSQFPGRLYIITGDFNDETEDPSLQALLNGPGEKLMDTLADQPRETRLTWPADSAKSGKYPPGQFDHILIPQSMKDRLVDSQVLDYGQATATASDHKPIRARFRLANR
ncbi:endonuclease/exonuclease/phosphatase family protein [bacterium]|nr:endonuclease/exonuclease/phosphatase family protein [bacterium]